MKATYKKLKNGGWGIIVEGSPKEGDKLTVTKKDGSTKAEIVKDILWAGDGKSICSIVPTERTYDSRRRCAECGRPGALVIDMEDGMPKHYRCCDIPP